MPSCDRCTGGTADRWVTDVGGYRRYQCRNCASITIEERDAEAGDRPADESASR